MDRITLHIPETVNDGLPLSKDSFARYEAALLDLTADDAGSRGQGFTLTHAIGVWRSPSGAQFRERLRLYAVDVADASSVLGAVRALASSIGRELDQEAVYLAVTPILAQSLTHYVAA
jgi:hypothetical protein